MKCTWCRREYKEKMIEDLDKSPLFGVPICDRCWEAEEEAYIEVIRDLEANIDKTHRWPMYWRVLEKVAGNPWEHIPLIKLTRIRRDEGGTFQMETSQSGEERTGKISCGVDKISSLAPDRRRG